MNAEKQVLSAWKGHPAFSPESCINRRQRRCTCTVCTELCPRGVFSLKAGENLRWDRCIDCGLCVSLCPRQAIEIGPETDRMRTVFLTPWKCTACGLCLRVCPHGGIAEMHTVSVPKLTQLALVRVPSASCERCGCSIPPGSDPPLCPSCAAKAKKR